MLSYLYIQRKIEKLWQRGGRANHFSPFNINIYGYKFHPMPLRPTVRSVNTKFSILFDSQYFIICTIFVVSY